MDKKRKKRIQTFSLKCTKKAIKNSPSEVSLRQAVLTLLFKIGVTIQNSIRKTAISQRSLPHVVTSPYKIAFLFECKHSQKAILHGSE